MNLIISHDRAVRKAGYYRAKDEDGTLEAAERAAQSLSSEGLVEKTRLDRAGIPCFSFIRKKTAIGGCGIHYGADCEVKRAMASTLLSAIEEQSSEYLGDRMDVLCFEDIGFLKGIQPEDLLLPRKLKEKEAIQWSQVRDIMNQKDMLVPSNAVFHPYDCLGMVEPLFRSTTLGLAAGSTTVEAVLYGLYDVILIDALSQAETNREHGRRILVEDGAAMDMIVRLEAAGINVRLWLLPGRTGLPCVVAAADDDLSKKPGLLVSGFGSHQDPEIAVISALNEVVKERIDYIENGRYNAAREAVLEKAGYERLKRINRLWYGEGEDTIGIEDIGSTVSGYLDDDLASVIDMLEETADHILVADLTRTEVPVVRVIIPGFELSHLDTGRSSKGADEFNLNDDGLFSMDTGGRDFQRGTGL